MGVERQKDRQSLLKISTFEKTLLLLGVISQFSGRRILLPINGRGRFLNHTINYNNLVRSLARLRLLAVHDPAHLTLILTQRL